MVASVISRCQQGRAMIVLYHLYSQNAIYSRFHPAELIRYTNTRHMKAKILRYISAVSGVICTD